MLWSEFVNRLHSLPIAPDVTVDIVTWDCDESTITILTSRGQVRTAHDIPFPYQIRATVGKKPGE